MLIFRGTPQKKHFFEGVSKVFCLFPHPKAPTKPPFSFPMNQLPWLKKKRVYMSHEKHKPGPTFH